MDNRRAVVLLTAFGGLAGLLLGIPDSWTSSLHGMKPLGHIVIGAVIGALIVPALWVAKPIFGRFQIETVKLPFPGKGEVTLRLTGGQRQVAWRVFVDLSTRVTAWSIQETASDGTPHQVGALRPAFDSLYSLFSTVRKELNAMPPSMSFADGQRTFEAYMLQLINKAVRPFLARWHPKFDEWEKDGKPDEAWPLNELCRQDLEITRENCLVYIWALGTALKLKGLDDILPQSGAFDRNHDNLSSWKPKELSPIEDIIAVEGKPRESNFSS